ncbi:MAG: hypothetical protein ACRBCJ_11635 [Hyphomicrobiaceae bacterium]
MNLTGTPLAHTPTPSVRNFAKQLIRPAGRCVRDTLLYFDLWPKLKDVDRIVLDEKIFPYIRERDDFHNILFIGCHWYTWNYNRVFADKNYSTLEIDPSQARYGAKKHITASVEDVAKHYAPQSLDLVFLLGVIGWGLDDRAVADRAIGGIHNVLRPGGALIIGWDDVPAHKPFALEELKELERFSPWTFPPLQTNEYLCKHELCHTFNFYERH